jgi:hypothetical protein
LMILVQSAAVSICFKLVYNMIFSCLNITLQKYHHGSRSENFRG